MASRIQEHPPTARGPVRTAPTGRLLWWTALVFVPGCTLATAGEPLIGAAVAAAAVVVALVDRRAAGGVLDAVDVEAEELVRAGKGKPFTLDLVVRAARSEGAPKRLRIGLELPEEIDGGGRIREHEVPVDRGRSVLRWPMRGRRRGRYLLERVFVEATSPIGLWVRRRGDPAAVELRVYPDLGAERRRLAAVFLHRGGIGTAAQRQVGKGRDFEQLREYTPGDDYGDIFWKATARRGFPITKMFQVERTQEVYVVVDHSRLTAREVAVPGAEVDRIDRQTQLERFIAAALSLGLVAERQGDLFGVATFADQVDGFIRARNGKGHYDACRDALYNLQPSMVSPDFEELVIFLRTRLTRRALLVILTDLSDALTAESFADQIHLVTRQHVVLVVALKPPGAGPLFDGEPVATGGEIYDRLAGQFQWEELLEVGNVLGKRGARFLMPDRDALAGDMVGQYLAIKQRQLI